MTILQVIPLKTTKQLPLRPSLLHWIDTSHPHYSSTQCSPDITRLDSLHSDISNAISTSETGHALALANHGMRDLVEYHACLVECERRGFPISGDGDGGYAEVNGTVDARLEFWWRDAFVGRDGHDEDSLTAGTKGCLRYERAGVLWNIAALHTYQASQQSWTTKSGRTTVHSSYRLATHILHHIRTTLLSTTPPSSLTPDLSPPSLSTLQSICAAQGQLCAYTALKERLARDPSNISTLTLLAKVAAGVASHYDDALGFSQDMDLRASLPKTTRGLGKHCKALGMLFRARAEYLTSRVECGRAEFGKEIGRLGMVAGMLREGMEFVGSESAAQTETVGPVELGNVRGAMEALGKTVEERRRVVVGENASIYHERVVEGEDLEGTVGQDVVALKGGELEDLPVELMPESLERPFFASLP